VEARYRVMREDDNGNRFLVRWCETADEAKEVAARLEARGHKQHYWVEVEER